MPVSFLDLVPALPTATVTINTRTGPTEIELTGISLRALAEIAKRYPSFRNVIEGELGGIMDDPYVMAAVIAASLGYLGDAECEERLLAISAADAVRMVGEIVRITFAQPDPLAIPAAAGAAAGDGLDRTSPSALNN
jgi:hypothetical protein